VSNRRVPIPPPQVCKLCGYDDNVSLSPLGDPGVWSYVCAGGRAHVEPYEWQVPVEDPMLGICDGIRAELGVYDDLLVCVHAGEPWVEYGIAHGLDPDDWVLQQPAEG
jgi:hypothetical protein